jgi:hypothetical protein
VPGAIPARPTRVQPALGEASPGAFSFTQPSADGRTASGLNRLRSLLESQWSGRGRRPRLLDTWPVGHLAPPTGRKGLAPWRLGAPSEMANPTPQRGQLAFGPRRRLAGSGGGHRAPSLIAWPTSGGVAAYKNFEHFAASLARLCGGIRPRSGRRLNAEQTRHSDHRRRHIPARLPGSMGKRAKRRFLCLKDTAVGL